MYRRSEWRRPPNARLKNTLNFIGNFGGFILFGSIFFKACFAQKASDLCRISRCSLWDILPFDSSEIRQTVVIQKPKLFTDPKFASNNPVTHYAFKHGATLDCCCLIFGCPRFSFGTLSCFESVMRATIFAAMMMAVIFSGAGCFPVHQTISPGVSGVVVDAHSHVPISGAEAVIAYTSYHPPTIPDLITNTRPPTVFTKADGSFMIPQAQRRIWISILPIDHFYPFSTLIVRADGYIPAIIPVTSIGLRDTNVSEILLLPKK